MTQIVGFVSSQTTDITILRFQPRDQILLCNSRWTSIQSNMASGDACSSASVAFSEYYAGLTGPAKTRYREKVLTCGFDPYMLKNRSVARI